MCVVGRQEDTLQIWPTLLEKAYISLRGGYDFRGSNSSIDLHALTGWIPEQIGFQHSDFQREKTWQRLKKAYDKGRLLVTAGTSRDVDKLRLPGQSHLVDSHNYAVMCLEEDEGEGWLTLMNPWETGPEREIIRMRWSEACARLDTLYLNWDPVIFAHQLQWHGIWRQDSKQSPSVELIVKQSCEVWLLLTRHTAVSSHDAMSEWISLHLFGSQEDQSSSKRGVYVDSTHTLLRSNVKSGKWKIAASRQGGNEECSFTLFAYSLSEIIWQDLAASSSSHGSTVKGQWTSKTAGGNSTQATFLHNPQYSITLKSKTNLTITVHTSKDVPVQVALVWSRGKRVAQVTQGDLVATSGIYTYGLALTEASELKAGSYTLILSTFDKGQLGSFEMQLQSDQAMQCLEIPPEGAGKYHQQIRHRWTEETAQGSPKHSGYFSNPTYEIKVDRICLFIFRLIVTAQDRPPSNVAVFSKSTRKEVISSGSYADLVCGVAIEETRLEPGTYIVVVSTYHAGSSCPFTLDMYSDRRIVYEKING
jgi:calpain-7